ncbi:MAG: DUF3488 domain-containing protein [Candidatus Saccharimonas sp.]|nr:DUF3488 domain-containing protein [Planctomycetaceae bacterium]
MDLGTVFKLSLYGLTALVGWILGAAEHQSWLPYGSLPFVILGYLWCEARGGSRQHGMSDTLASVFGFIALAVSTNEFFGSNPEGKLLAGTHLMVYLTWIVLLQSKTAYRCWLLLALGVLQVAVASVLTSGSWFGFCTIGYLFASVWTLSVFSLYRAEEQFATTARVDAADREQPAVPGDSSVATTRNSTLLFSQATGSVQHEAGGRWLTLRFLGGVTLTSVAGLVVSSLFFALVPRVWVGAPTGFSNEDLPGLKRRSMSGFSSDVRLGDMGPILESVDPVLELKLIDPRTGNTISPQTHAERHGLAEPLLRGAVLTKYWNGRWAAVRLSELAPQRLYPNYGSNSVRQEIRLEPIGTDVLFCLGHPLSLSDDRGQSSAAIQWLTDLAYRGPDFPKSGVVRYSVHSDMPTQRSPEPAGLKVSPYALSLYEKHGYLGRNLELPEGLKRLAGLARGVVHEAQQRRGRNLTNLEVARALESHLLMSGQYKYTLDQSIQDASIDPVEDFLFNRKEGHCEYFASALVLMLRSRDIPARLVTGFKGGDLRSDNSLHIQQRFAHAWVEAWVDPNVWITLDGTPNEARAASVAEIATRRSVWTDVRSTLSGLWSENVVNITFDRQKEMIYTPLREVVMAIWASLQSLWPSSEMSLESFLLHLIDPRNWFSAGGAVTLSMLAVLLWFVRNRPHWFRWPWRGWRRSRQPTARQWIEFYERFTRLMQLRGLQREPTQTQQEFAALATETLDLELRSANLNGVPHAVSEFFYRVRFGDETLSDAEASLIESQLSFLEHALAPADTRQPPRRVARNGAFQ